ncbi:Opa3 domain-containing protein [Lasiodiplodia theobromae]|uniref:Opa3 domain-containing protein n=1 Tax=Lasiodiplodia theobromae TaxID=45133 RepID=UPI0015C3BE03|nr:Opa3 domain-containing protein [Lasiodiplodia theobromae]KAF4537085.1 Opa3 domain-containing protein [Lasiodiplodia theobromae]
MNTSQPDSHQQQQQQQSTSGLHAYTHLSATLLTDPSLSSIPLLPLTSTSALSPLLKTYIRTNSAGRAARQVQERRQPDDAFNTAFDLLPQCTAAGAAVAPLSRDALFRLTDLFGSLHELSDVAVRHEQGDERVSEKVKRMMGLLGEQTTSDVLEFWVDEWVAD